MKHPVAVHADASNPSIDEAIPNYLKLIPTSDPYPRAEFWDWFTTPETREMLSQKGTFLIQSCSLMRLFTELVKNKKIL